MHLPTALLLASIKIGPHTRVPPCGARQRVSALQLSHCRGEAATCICSEQCGSALVIQKGTAVCWPLH